MKTIFLLCYLLLTATTAAFSQVVASVNLSGDLKTEPGVSNEVTVSVKNTQKVAIIKYKSDYVVTMMYRGSGTAGEAFNMELNLGDPLDPGATRNLKIKFTGPVMPGEYDVDVFLKWGNKTVSNVEKIKFVVAADYGVSLTAKTTSLNVKRGATRFLQLHFTAANSGKTTWPEGNYSFQFSVISSPGGAGTYDKDAFNISPKVLERWDFEPGESDEYDITDFKPPFTAGSYVVKVTVLLNGKPFNAEGASKNFTFKVNVSD
jgi:hypothetical protein